jgi:DedD protein
VAIRNTFATGSEDLKTRLLGAAVLVALMVLFVPMFFSSTPPTPGGDQAVSLAIPPAPDRDLQTRTMSLTPDQPAGAGMATKAAPVSGDQLATVEIGSQRPRDVETDPEAGKPRAPTTVKIGSGASASQPVIPQRTQPDASPPSTATEPKSSAVPKSKPEREQTAKPVTKAVSKPESPAPAAAHGSYTLNLSAYASASGAASLERRVRALGYPVTGHAITQAGKSQTMVIAGPFETRAAAEAARLKITQSIPGAPARVEQDASHESAASPSIASTPAVRSKAGGYAVQLAAVSSQTDANALRDKLRASGFDGFVDSVQSGGTKLWRVRAGPQTQRADAQRVHDQIKAKLGLDGNVVSVP